MSKHTKMNKNLRKFGNTLQRILQNNLKTTK